MSINGSVDGSIVVDTELDTQGFEAGTDKMQNAVDSAIKGYEKLGATLGATSREAQKFVDEWANAMPEKEFQASVDAITKQVDSMAAKLSEVEQIYSAALDGESNAIAKFENKAASAQAGLDKISETLNELYATSVKTENAELIPASEMGNLGLITDKAYDFLVSLTSMRNKIAEVKAESSNMLPSSDTLAYNNDIAKIEKGITQLENKMFALGIAAKKALREDSENAVDSFNVKAHAAQNLVQSLRSQLESLGNAGVNISGYDELVSRLNSADNKLGEYSQQVNNAEKKTNILISTLKAVGKVGVTSFKLLGKGVSAVVNQVKSLGKSADGTMAAAKKITKSFTSFGARIKSLLKRRIIRSILNGAIEGVKNLAQASPEVNAAMSSLVTALSQLKNSFGTAFAPILTAVAPILTTLINLLSEAFTKVGMLIAALTGASSFKKAVTVQKDYAASLKDTAKQANKAQKALAGFDELNNTSTQQNAAGTSIDPTSMFEDVPVDSKIKAFADKIKKAFLSGDFEGIGKAAAAKVNSIFKKINDVLDNEKVTGKVVNFVKGLCNGFNRFVDDVDFEQIGSAIGKGINKIVDVIHAFWTGVNWKKLGSQLSKGLNGVVKKVNWAKLGQTIGSKFQAVLSFLNGAVTSFEFDELAAGVATGINNAFASIDFSMLGETLSTGIKKVFDAITTFAETVDWTAVGEDIAEFLNNIDWPGIFGSLARALSNMLSGLLDTLIAFVSKMDWAKLGKDLWNSLVAIITNIKWGELIAKAFKLLGAAIAGIGNLVLGLIKAIWATIVKGYNSIKGYFNKKIEECGGNIVLGILKGIVDGLVGIGKWIYNHIFKPIWDGICSVFGIHSPSTKMMEVGKNIILGLLNGMISLVKNVLSFIGNLALDIIKGIASLPGKALEIGKKFISWLWDGMKSVGSTLINGVKTVAGWVKDGLSGLASKAWDIGKGVVSGICNGMKWVGHTLKNAVKTVAGWVTDGLSGLASKAWDIGKSIVSKLGSGLQAVGSGLKSAVSTVGGWISSGLSSIGSKAVQWGKDIVGGLVNGITKVKGNLGSVIKVLADKVKDNIGFSEPKEGPLSDFHTYMPDMIKLMCEGIEDNKKYAINAVADLAAGMAEEAQDASVLVPINAENKYTNFLNNFSDKITEAFLLLIKKLEAIAGGVAFATPALATGTVLPYRINSSYDQIGGGDSNGGKPTDVSGIIAMMERIEQKLDDVVEAIDEKETGITDADVYKSVKNSVRKEKKSTGRDPFSE